MHLTLDVFGELAPLIIILIMYNSLNPKYRHLPYSTENLQQTDNLYVIAWLLTTGKKKFVKHLAAFFRISQAVAHTIRSNLLREKAYVPKTNIPLFSRHSVRFLCGI